MMTAATLRQVIAIAHRVNREYVSTLRARQYVLVVAAHHGCWDSTEAEEEYNRIGREVHSAIQVSNRNTNSRGKSCKT